MIDSLMSPLRGLYAITPDALCAQPEELLMAVTAALRGGARLIQYRDKAKTSAQVDLQLAAALRALCTAHRAGLIINDDARLAARIGAHGVHLGANDGSVQEARALLGPAAIIGVSCGPHLQRARDGLAAGASYVAFGRFFPSHTKPNAPQAPLTLLAEARAEITAPICAIGGVTPQNGALLIAAGADLLAAVEGVFADADPQRVEAAARAYSALFVGNNFTTPTQSSLCTSGNSDAEAGNYPDD
jgi:thiamine-phosphate pyrophosphorylase